MATVSYSSVLIGAIAILLINQIDACPSGTNRNEKVEPLGLCGVAEPKCPPNAYCFPLQWTGFWQFQWVCCPNISTIGAPSPPLFPQPILPPMPPQVIPPHEPNPNNVIDVQNRMLLKKTKGIPVTIPFNDASRQQLPFAIMNLVQEQIQKYPILIFSLSTCPWCKRSKELFDDFYPGLTYYYFDYDLNPDGNPIANAAMGVSGMRTVPMIYVCQQLIGGFTDLQNLHVAHELQSRIEKCATM